MKTLHKKIQTHKCTEAQRRRHRLKHYAALCKIKISLFSTVSAAAGYMLAQKEVSTDIIIPVMGVFLLACGACALNQYQERGTDALMERTMPRPIPSGKITPEAALRFSGMLLTAGFFLLTCSGFINPSLLGAGAVFWYNGVYTYLKRVTAFAAVPGALIGAIPPAIGWTAAGGDLADVKILAVCVFFFIWQVPHFWLIFLSNSNDFKKAGFPTIRDKFNEEQISRITSIWILSAAAAGLTIPLFIISLPDIFNAVLFAACLWLVSGGIILIKKSTNPSLFYAAFKRINIYMLIVMLLIGGVRFF